MPIFRIIATYSEILTVILHWTGSGHFRYYLALLSKSPVCTTYKWGAFQTGLVSKQKVLQWTLTHSKAILATPCRLIPNICFLLYRGHTPKHESFCLSVIYHNVLKVWHPNQRHLQHCLWACWSCTLPSSLQTFWASSLGMRLNCVCFNMLSCCYCTLKIGSHRCIGILGYFLFIILYMPLFHPFSSWIVIFMTSLPTLREKMNLGPISSTLFMTEGAFSSKKIS